MRIDKRKLSIVNLFEYLFAFFVLISSSSMYSAMQVHHMSNSFFKKCAVLMAFFIVCYYLIKYGKMRVKEKNAAVVCIFIVHNLIYVLATRYNIKDFFMNFMLLVYAFVVLCIVMRNTRGYFNLIEKYCNIVLVVALISLFCYVFGTLLNVLPGASTISYTKMNLWYTCKTYYGVYFEAQDQYIMGIRLVRNCGIFMEAPGYAFPLTMALLYEMFKKVTPRKWVCAVLTVTGLTTLSTKVMITMTLTYIIYFFTNERTKGAFLKVMKIVAAPVILVAGGIFIYFALSVKIDENSASFLGRMDALQATVHVWLDHPIFGSGFKNDPSVREYFTHIKSDYNGITAGFTCVLAEGGLWLMGMYLFAMFNLLKNAAPENKKLVKVFLFIFFVYWVQSSLQFSTITLFVIAMGLSEPVRTLETPINILLKRIGLDKRIKVETKS